MSSALDSQAVRKCLSIYTVNNVIPAMLSLCVCRLKLHSWDWREGSMVRRTSLFSRGPESVPQHTCKNRRGLCAHNPSTGRWKWTEPGSALVSPAEMVRFSFSERLRLRDKGSLHVRCALIHTQQKEDLLSQHMSRVPPITRSILHV